MAAAAAAVVSNGSPHAAAAIDAALWSRVRAGQFEDSLLIFSQLRAHSCSPTSRSWNALLHGAVVARRSRHFGRAVLRAMEAAAVPVDATTVHLRLLWRALGEPPAWDTAATEVRDAVTASVRVAPATWMVLVRGLVGAGRLGTARAALAAMSKATEGSGRPNGDADSPYCAAMLACLRRKDATGALEIYDDCVEARSNSAPLPVQLFNMALEALAVLGSMPLGGDAALARGADGVLSVMRERKVQPNAATFASYAELLIRCDKVEDARRVPDQMRAVGVAPDVHIYTKLMAALVRSGQIRDAIDVYREMDAEGIMPNVVTASVLLTALGSAGYADRADRLFARLPAMGIKPNVYVYNALVAAHTRSGLTAGARNEAATEAPRVPSAADMESAERIVSDMAAAGIPPDIITITTLVTGYTRAGMLTTALAILLREAHVFLHHPRRYKVRLDAISRAAGAAGAAAERAGDVEAAESSRRLMDQCTAAARAVTLQAQAAPLTMVGLPVAT